MPKESKNKWAYDAVLLRIHRQYGKDESTKYLFDEISRLQFQIGELKSENAELAAAIQKAPAEEKKPSTSVPKEWTKELYAKELKTTIKRMVKTNSEAKKNATEWRDKYFSLLAKYNKDMGIN